MKKLLATMMTVLFCAMMPMSALAATVDNDVWIDAKSGTVNGSQLVVSVETNGKATDGLLKITYDSSAVSCTEESVVFDESVEMYSVNAEEEGVLKISYLSGDAIPAGGFVDVNFTVASEDISAEDAGVKLSGEANTADGSSLTVGMKGEASDDNKPGGNEPGDNKPGDNKPGDNKPGGNGNKPGGNTSGNNQTPDKNGSVAGTGDANSVVLPIAALLAAGTLAGAMVFYRKKESK